MSNGSRIKTVAFGALLLTTVALSVLLAPCQAQTVLPQYPTNFLWGSGISAHQHEGGQEGGNNSDWWTFEHPSSGTASPIKDRQTADYAADHWAHYAEDIDAAANAGMNALLISIAWEKVEPSPGSFNQKALAHYRDVLTKMRARGIRPIVVLQQYTHPRWFHEKGGWLSPDSPRQFLEYAAAVVDSLKDLCDIWITFYEPMHLVVQGYLNGVYPPNISSSDSAFEAAFQIARTHRIVGQMIHDAQGYSPGGHGDDGTFRGVGIASDLQLYDPENPADEANLDAAEAMTEFFNWAFIRGVHTGRLEFSPPTWTGYNSFARDLPSQDLPPWDVGPSLDWLGVNYDTRYLVKLDPASPGGMLLHGDKQTVRGEDGRDIYPQGLEQILRATAERFPYPLVVTANGVADGRDTLRPTFLRKHFQALDAAVFGAGDNSPLDIRGYFYRSLLDGFDWLAGYTQRTGLISVDFKKNARPRRGRSSLSVYAAKIQDSSPPR